MFDKTKEVCQSPEQELEAPPHSPASRVRSGRAGVNVNLPK